ncbi:MAG: hypothetical protein RBT74_10640 [Tenuifilaceae bacterium]|jgi:hypothetical protein|nr:hypothetical protein [Tenuifilaceae bacterium]
MESREKTLKERLPHNAISDITELVGMSYQVVSRVINRTVKFRRADGRVVRACSVESERRILDVAESYAKRHEELKESLRSVG